MPDAVKPSTRSSGLLLHPTSLPGPFGVGDLGPAAYAWIDALAQAAGASGSSAQVAPTSQPAAASTVR